MGVSKKMIQALYLLHFLHMAQSSSSKKPVKKPIKCGSCHQEGHTRSNRKFHPLSPSSTDEPLRNSVVCSDTPAQLLAERSDRTPLVCDIQLFTKKKGAGDGRDKNDAKNKKREILLADLYAGVVDPAFFKHETFGPRWTLVKERLHAAIDRIVAARALVGPFSISLLRMGGRGKNYDYQLDIHHSTGLETVFVEFKFGTKTIKHLPQYLNLSAIKLLTAPCYALYFYTHCFQQLLNMFEDLKDAAISECDYLKHVHNNTTKNTLLLSIHEKYLAARKSSDKATEKAMKELASQSIRQFLELHATALDLAALNEEIKRSQKNKVFLLFDDDEFYLDEFKPSELEITAILGVRNGNVIDVQSAEPGTTHALLLRWKNSFCGLFPAWQIGLKRA